MRLAAAQIAYLILLYPLAKTKKFVNKIFYLSTPRFEKTNVYNRQNVYRRADTDCACPPCLPKSAADKFFGRYGCHYPAESNGQQSDPEG